MTSMPCEWREIEEFSTTARELLAKHSGQLAGVDPDQIIAYMCVNKERLERNAKVYEMTVATEPESLTNTKTYFVKMFRNDWKDKSRTDKLALVLSILKRIDLKKASIPRASEVGGYHTELPR